MVRVVASDNRRTGNAKKSPTFLPTSLPGLAFWIDAKQIAGLTDGTSVAQWNDSSWFARHATQGTGTNKPTYKTAILNGLPVVRFAAPDDWLAIPAIDCTASSAVTAYVTITNLVSAANSIIYEMSANNDLQTDSFVVFTTNAGGSTAQCAATGDVGKTDFTSTATVHTTPHQITYLIDKSLSTNEATIWVDGATAGSRATNNNNTNAFGNRAGFMGMRSGGSLPLTADIAEFWIFAAAHTASQRVAMETYLKRKWGTP